MDLHRFITDNSKAGSISVELKDKIFDLFNEYKSPILKPNMNIINTEFGFNNFGNIIIRHVEKVLYEEGDSLVIKYEKDSYDYISILSDKTTNILWTDFERIEPYNRNGCFYCDGASFESLGEPIFQNDFYREFISTSYFKHNISFAIYEFYYNTYYESIRFGLCIEENKTEEFIQKLRKLINK